MRDQTTEQNAGQKTDQTIERIKAYITEHQVEALGVLRQLVEIQSGSWNKPGLDQMARTMGELLAEIVPHVRVLPFSDHGDMVQASTRAFNAGKKGCILVGHMDTVFPADTSFTSYREDDEHCYGPGVYDMKGGLVAGIYALKALDSLGLLRDIPVSFLCNSDEEIGSPASRSWIEEQARGAFAALVLEGGGMHREVVTGRKGRLGFRMTVFGQAGHAAKAGPKASAIQEMAHKILALEGLNDGVEITVNVGRIEGGIGPNTVPDTATALVDSRFFSSAGQAHIQERVAAIAASCGVPGTSCTWETTTGRPAMAQTEANLGIYAMAREQALSLGYDLPHELRFGVSDANFIAGQGIPVLDGLGPVGNLDHSDREYIVKSSLAQRSALVAATLLGLWRNPPL